MSNTDNAKKVAIQIAEDLKGVNNCDNVIHNVGQVCDYVIDTLRNVIGPPDMWTENQKANMLHWQEVKKQSNLIY